MAGAVRRVPIWITVGGVALFLSGVALFIGTIDRCAGVVLGAPPTAKIDADGTLRLAGSINATLVAAARKASGKPDHQSERSTSTATAASMPVCTNWQTFCDPSTR